MPKYYRPHNPEVPACVLHFDGGKRIYVVLDVEDKIIGLLEGDRQSLINSRYENLPVYGPMKVTPEFVDVVFNASKRDREILGIVLHGLIDPKSGGLSTASVAPGPVVQYRENNRTVTKKRLLSR